MKLKDANYLKFVRTLPCSMCASTPSEAHHENYWLEYGSQRMNDYVAVPLCAKHHRDRHTFGAKNFWTTDKFILVLLLTSLNYLSQSKVLSGRTLDEVEEITKTIEEFKNKFANCADKSENNVYNKYSERCVRDVVLEYTEYISKVVTGDNNE